MINSESERESANEKRIKNVNENVTVNEVVILGTVIEIEEEILLEVVQQKVVETQWPYQSQPNLRVGQHSNK